MEKIFKPGLNMWAIEAAPGCVLHRVGSEDWTPQKQAVVADPEEWEEVTEGDVPAYSKAEYDAEVERLIALRYSHGKEIEVNRERETRPERFEAYLAYVEACKAQAREALMAAPEEEDSENSELSEGSEDSEDSEMLNV